MNPCYERQDGEGEYEYGLRLIATKVEDKPDDLDWEDIVEALSLDIHRDTLRKAASVSPYSGYAVMKYFTGQGVKPPVRVTDQYQEQKEKVELRDQRTAFNADVRREARMDNLVGRLTAAAEKMCREYPFERPELEIRGPATGTEAVLVLSDWHYGMVADNVWEHFNTDVCRERVKLLVRKAAGRLVWHGCDRLHVLMLGDFVNGGLHVSSRVASDELVADQLMQVSELLACAVADLSECVPETRIYATYGNHARVTPNYAESLHRDNFERIVPWWLEQRFRDRDDIHVEEDTGNEFVQLEVCGKNIVASHGDLDVPGKSGRLLGTLFSKRYGVDVDYIILGHRHHKEVLEELGIEVIGVRSLCGTDEYANKKRLYSTPGQSLLIFDPDEGLDARYDLLLK